MTTHVGPDPRSADYARDYNNGWRAAKRSNARLSFGVPLDSARHRDVSCAWRDGFYDKAADQPKWTYRQARLAGWDNTGNYLFALYCAQEWAQELAGLPSYGTDEQQAVVDALSAFQAVPSQANLDAINDAVGPARKVAQRPTVPGSSVPDVAEPGNSAGEELASALRRTLVAIAADLDARGRAASSRTGAEPAASTATARPSRRRSSRARTRQQRIAPHPVRGR